jgi:hypothetical protein
MSFDMLLLLQRRWLEFPVVSEIVLSVESDFSNGPLDRTNPFPHWPAYDCAHPRRLCHKGYLAWPVGQDPSFAP